MNSLRIGIVGILVNYWGPQDADGFLHMFEGWIIFIACAGVLVAEMTLLARLVNGKRFFEVFYPPKISASSPQQSSTQAFNQVPLLSCLFLLCAVSAAGLLVSARQEIQPDRTTFAAFPHQIGDWRGRPAVLGSDVERGLGLTDYILSDYAQRDGRQVNLYIAYYASQRSGLSPHSPSVCIPGNGWQITQFDRTHYTDNARGISLPINRVIIGKGSSKQLVYYWFEQRGMRIANEYLSKLYLLRDAILMNRTDGALVRLTTSIYPTETEADADKRLQEFTQAVLPKLTGYLPSDGSKIKPAMTPLKSNHSS
jgi:exosortase D (VPLPA-CTERM-specific)